MAELTEEMQRTIDGLVVALGKIACRDDAEMAQARTLHYDMRGIARAALERYASPAPAPTPATEAKKQILQIASSLALREGLLTTDELPAYAAEIRRRLEAQDRVVADLACRLGKIARSLPAPGPATEELERLRLALQQIADFTASRDDPLNPYEQIARHAKDTARSALRGAHPCTPRSDAG